MALVPPGDQPSPAQKEICKAFILALDLAPETAGIWDLRRVFYFMHLMEGNVYFNFGKTWNMDKSRVTDGKNKDFLPVNMNTKKSEN